MNNTVKDKRTLYRHNNLSFPEIAFTTQVLNTKIYSTNIFSNKCSTDI